MISYAISDTLTSCRGRTIGKLHVFVLIFRVESFFSLTTLLDQTGMLFYFTQSTVLLANLNSKTEIAAPECVSLGEGQCCFSYIF